MNESELLQRLQSLGQPPYYYNQGNFAISKVRPATKNIAAGLQRISLFRRLEGLSGQKKDPLPYVIDSRYRAIDNAQLFGLVADVDVSMPFRTLDRQRIVNVLSASPLFSDENISERDFESLSLTLMAKLRIGFPDAYLV
jgi:hypothetical protein